MKNKVLLKNGILVGLEPLKLEPLDLLIEDGRVAAREPRINAQRDTLVIECRGKFVMPGLVNAHFQLSGAQALGMPAPTDGTPADFEQRLERVWWRLERALTPETVVTAAFAAAMDGIRLGTTTMLGLQSAPSAIEDSLQLIADALLTVGIRSVLGYEVRDAEGLDARDAGLAENQRFASWHRTDKVAGVIGACASHALSDETLTKLAAAAKAASAGFHVRVAEHPFDAERSLERFGAGPIERFDRHGLLGPKSVLALGTHLAEADRRLIAERGAWLVHCPVAESQNGSGFAPVETFGELAALGTGPARSDLLGEARAAFIAARSRGASFQAEDAIRLLVGGQQLASDLLGLELGSTRRDAGADFLILNYQPRTPITNDNLAEHILFGFGPECIDTVLVDGTVVYRNGIFPEMDGRRLAPLVRKGAEQLWEAIASPAGPDAPGDADDDS